MILATILAHLVGDYILQWDKLSRWKSKDIRGVLVHGAIVTAVTWLFSLPFDPGWWPWALFIGLTHTLIDGLELPIRRRLAQRGSGKGPLALFVGDQLVHITIILLALRWSGYIAAPGRITDIASATGNNLVLLYILAYAFLTMPAWIIIKFLVYGLMNGSPPDFSNCTRTKYMGMVERGLIVTLVLFGQFFFLPLVALPRLVMDWSSPNGHNPGLLQHNGRQNTLYLAELFSSIILAVIVGLALRQLP